VRKRKEAARKCPSFITKMFPCLPPRVQRAVKQGGDQALKECRKSPPSLDLIACVTGSKHCGSIRKCARRGPDGFLITCYHKVTFPRGVHLRRYQVDLDTEQGAIQFVCDLPSSAKSRELKHKDLTKAIKGTVVECAPDHFLVTVNRRKTERLKVRLQDLQSKGWYIGSAPPQSIGFDAFFGDSFCYRGKPTRLTAKQP
jgi:hypothetical protein